MTWNHDTDVIAIDTEATGISKEDYPFATSLCDNHGNNLYFEWEVDPFTRTPIVSKQDKKQIKRLCRGKTLVFHNMIFDIEMLDRVDIKLNWRKDSYDTSVMSHAVDSKIHSELKGRLKDLAIHYMDYPEIDQSDLKKAVSSARAYCKKHLPFWKICPIKKGGAHLLQDYWLPRQLALHLNYEDDHPWFNLCRKYADGDTKRTMLLYLLFKKLMKKWKPERLATFETERKLSNVLHDMRQHGIYISIKKTKKRIKELEKDIKDSALTMSEIAGNDEFNPNSAPQLRDVLFKDLGFEPKKLTATNQASTDKSVRKDLLELILFSPRKGRMQKRRKSFLNAWELYSEAVSDIRYLKSYQELAYNNRIYPSLIQNGTGTTRLSSRDPNGQNIKKPDKDKQGNVIKKGLRSSFGPAPGRIWYCLDYSQLQLRIFAFVSGESSMVEAFNKGYDFHGFIASKIFDVDVSQVTTHQRRIGKNTNFGFIFGASPKKIELTAGVDGLWDTVCQMFPSAHQFMDRTKSLVKNKGHVITPFGYQLTVDMPHKGVNFIVQGSEGEIVKASMVEVEEYLSDLQYGVNPFDGYMLFQVHDELIFDFPADDSRNESIIQNIAKIMETPAKRIGMNTPVDIEYTKTNWEGTKEYVSL